MSSTADPRIQWHASADADSWAADVADRIAGALREALAATSAPVRLLVSGGTTPAPAYQRLAAIDLDWSRIVIGLVDDRDVAADDAGSNARAIREHLLRDRAAVARFIALREQAETAADAIAAANADWLASAGQTVAMAVLGMGDDGHTASLFPGARNLDDALSTTAPYALIDATGCPVAGTYHQRLSLTPFGLVSAQQRLLLIRGERKRDVLLSALGIGPVAAMPIRVAWADDAPPLQVCWCAQ